MLRWILASRRRAGGKHDELLSLLLATRDAESGKGLRDRQLHDEIMTIFFAGHETTANGFAFTSYLLATHPEADTKRQQELESVLGGRVPDYADIAQVRSARMVFEETSRLYPPVHAPGHAATRPDVIGGVEVPNGAVVSIYPYITGAVARSGGLRARPSSRAGPLHLSAVRRLPADLYKSSGFAMAEAPVVIASMAQRLRCQVAPGRTVQPIGLLTPRPKDGVWVTAAPR